MCELRLSPSRIVCCIQLSICVDCVYAAAGCVSGCVHAKKAVAQHRTQSCWQLAPVPQNHSWEEVRRIRLRRPRSRRRRRSHHRLHRGHPLHPSDWAGLGRLPHAQ